MIQQLIRNEIWRNFPEHRGRRDYNYELEFQVNCSREFMNSLVDDFLSVGFIIGEIDMQKMKTDEKAKFQLPERIILNCVVNREQGYEIQSLYTSTQ